MLPVLQVQLAADCSRSSSAQPVQSAAAGKQDSAKPPTSHLALGDSRINPFHTSYHSDFSPPFTWQASLAAAQAASAQALGLTAPCRNNKEGSRVLPGYLRVKVQTPRGWRGAAADGQPAGADSNAFSSCFTSQTGMSCRTSRLSSSAAQLCRALPDSMSFQPDSVSPACWSLAALARAAMQQQVLCSHRLHSPR